MPTIIVCITYTSVDYRYTYVGSGFFMGLASSSLSESLDELLAGFGAVLTGLLSTFLTFFFGASSSLDESELELSFLTIFLVGVEASFFFGAGASSSLEESSLDDSFGFGATFLAGVATFLAAGLAGASSSLESSEDDDSFGFETFFVCTTFFAGVFCGASSSLEESSDDDSFAFGAAFLAGVTGFMAFLTGTSSSLESSLDEDSFGFGADFVGFALTGAFFSDSLEESSLDDSAFFRMD